MSSEDGESEVHEAVVRLACDRGGRTRSAEGRDAGRTAQGYCEFTTFTPVRSAFADT